VSRRRRRNLPVLLRAGLWRAPLPPLLPAGDQSERKRCGFLAADADGTVEHADVFHRRQSGQHVERLAVAVKPAPTFPTSPYDKICPLRQNMRQGIGMQKPPVRDDDISIRNRRAIKPFAALLIGAMSC